MSESTQQVEVQSTEESSENLRFISIEGKPFLVNATGGVMPLNRKARRFLEAMQRKQKKRNLTKLF